MKKLFLIFGLLIPGLAVPAWPESAARITDGTDDRGNMGNINNVTTGNFTLCVWFKGTEDASSDWLAGKKVTPQKADAGYGMLQNGADFVGAFVSDGVNIASCTSDNDGDSWKFYALMWDGTNNVLQMFQNDHIECSSTSAAGVGSLTNSANFTVFESSSAGDDANATVTEVSFYNVLLSTSEVWDVKFDPDRRPSTYQNWRHWKFNGQNSPEVDVVQGTSGTLTGTTATTDGPVTPNGGVTSGYMLPMSGG